MPVPDDTTRAEKRPAIRWVKSGAAAGTASERADYRRIPVDLDGLKLVQFPPLPSDHDDAHQGSIPET